VIEFTAERIAASPLSYLLPTRTEPREGEPEHVAWPMVEERTVVAPPVQPAAAAEPEREPEPEPEPELEPEVAVEPEPEPEPEPAPAEPAPAVEPVEPLYRRLGSLLRRRGQDEEPAPPTPPRHVKLLPRRSAPRPSRAAEEVAELFGSSEPEPESREEPGG
jgi:hypothetical protein